MDTIVSSIVSIIPSNQIGIDQITSECSPITSVRQYLLWHIRIIKQSIYTISKITHKLNGIDLKLDGAPSHIRFTLVKRNTSGSTGAQFVYIVTVTVTNSLNSNGFRSTTNIYAR